MVLAQALAAARMLRARKLTGRLLQNLAHARHVAGDLSGARARYAEALTIAKASGAEGLGALIATHLAELEFRSGDAPAGMRLAGEALAALRTLNGARRVAVTLCNMAAYLLALERYDEARAHAREAVALARDAQSAVHLLFGLQHLAAVVALRPNDDHECAGNDRTRAARLLGYVDSQLIALEALREYTEQQEYDKVLAALGEALGEEDLAKLMDDGRAWSEDQAVAEALST